MVLLEAMAAGVPVLATDCGGAPEVVGEPQALFALGDDAMLASRLSALPTTERKGTEHAVKGCFTDTGAHARFWSLGLMPSRKS